MSKIPLRRELCFRCSWRQNGHLYVKLSRHYHSVLFEEDWKSGIVECPVCPGSGRWLTLNGTPPGCLYLLEHLLKEGEPEAPVS